MRRVVVGTVKRPDSEWPWAQRLRRTRPRTVACSAAGNTIAGIVGGGLGGQILRAVLGTASSGSLDIGSIIAQIASGGIGGGVLMVIVGMLKQMMAK